MGKQAGASTPRSRGAYGSTRGKERQRRRADNRARDPRYQEAMDQVRKEQEALDKLIEEQKQVPAVGAAAGAMYAARMKKAEEDLAVAKAAEEAIAAEEAVAEEAVVEYEDFEVDGIEIVAPVYPKYSTKGLPRESNDKFQFASTTAQMMLKAGYHIAYVIEFTGVGMDELERFPLDDWGYGWPDRDDDETSKTS